MEINKDIDDRIPGSLSQVNLDVKERELLLDYMKSAYPSSYTDFIWSLLGDDYFLMFFDVLEGLQVRIPSRQLMSRILSNIRIYSYLKERGCTPEAYEKAHCIFKKRESVLQKIYETVDKALSMEDLIETEEDEEQ